MAAANADTQLSNALRERKVTVKKLERIHDFRRIGRQNLHHQIRAIEGRKSHRTRAKRLSARFGSGTVEPPAGASDRPTTRAPSEAAQAGAVRPPANGRAADPAPEPERVDQDDRRSSVIARLRDRTRWPTTSGVWVIKPNVPKHIHQGNDITAASGTPIVAPFDGVAEASSNELGGLAVKVFGELGYVYNAHLSGYGKLGEVKAGDVIGYVGATGDAGGYHDHFEWHPGNGSAVDPYAYLMAVC